jgi:hypothetical protein
MLMAPSGPGEGRGAADRWPDKDDTESAAWVAAGPDHAEDLRQVRDLLNRVWQCPLFEPMIDSVTDRHCRKI